MSNLSKVMNKKCLFICKNWMVLVNNIHTMVILNQQSGIGDRRVAISVS